MAMSSINNNVGIKQAWNNIQYLLANLRHQSIFVTLGRLIKLVAEILIEFLPFFLVDNKKDILEFSVSTYLVE